MNWRTDFSMMPKDGTECFVWAMSYDGYFRPMVVFWSEALYDDMSGRWILCEDHEYDVVDFTHWATVVGPEKSHKCKECNGTSRVEMVCPWCRE